MTGENQTPEAEGTVADAYKGNWVDRLAPPATRPYLRLSRADRPIGTWLLLLPCWWGLTLAMLSDGQAGWHDLWIFTGCAVGAFLMRGAGDDPRGGDVDVRAGAHRLRDSPDLQLGGHLARGFVAAAGGGLPLCQALHLVAADLPWPRLQLGRIAGLDGAYRSAGGPGSGALPCRDRLDALL